jgi:phosphoesterase RecJ-like protein
MDRQTTFTQAASEWKQRIHNARTIMLVTHVNPDGDAVGALIGMLMALPQLTDATIIPVLQQPVPNYLAWLPGVEQSIAISASTAWPNPDLIIALDTSTLARIGGIDPIHLDKLTHSSIVQIDHHATNTRYGVCNMIVAESCATCEVITEFLPYLGVTITAGIATPLLLGIMTDTQSFQIYGTSAETLNLGSKLINAGADHQHIIEYVFRSTRLESLTLASRVINGMQRDGNIVWCGVPLAWVDELHASDDESDEAMHMLQRVAGLEIIMFIKERPHGVKISLRSRNVVISAVAQKHGGGGHAHASGIDLPGHTIQSAVDLVLPDLKAVCTDSSI